MEDVFKRLGSVETDVSELKSKVREVVATIAHLATQADVLDVRSAISELRAEMKDQVGTLRAEMKVQVGTLRAEMKEQVGTLRAEMKEQAGTLRAEMAQQYGTLRAEMAERETAFIKWIIGTVLTTAGLVFAIAKFVH